MDIEELASSLMALLAAHYPEAIQTRYKIEACPKGRRAGNCWRLPGVSAVS